MLLAGSAVAPCLPVTTRTLHLGQQTSSRRAGGQRAVRHSVLGQAGGGARARQINSAGLPLASVNGASRLALCVQGLGRRAHLQRSASGGCRRVQRIGGAVCGRGSGHGGTSGARESSVGGSAGWCGRRSDLRGERAAGSGGEGSAGHSMRRRAMAGRGQTGGRKEARRR
jgi:hypothetical protein